MSSILAIDGIFRRVEEIALSGWLLPPQNACGIYALVNAQTMQVYVGSSCNMRVRIIAHRSQMRSGAHENAKLREAAFVVGVESFCCGAILECEREDLERLEHETFMALGQERCSYNLVVPQKYPRFRLDMTCHRDHAIA